MSDSQHILVVLDPTAKTQPAVERGAWLAKHLRAPLELFICDYDQYLAGERFFDSPSLEKTRKSLVDAHRRRLGKHARTLERQGLTVSVDARWDHPLHEGIVRKALQSGSRIIVKDTHYHPILKRTLFSNTDWSLIRLCPAPLLLVKPRTLAARPRVIAAVDPLHERDKPAELDDRILETAKDLCAAADGELHVFHAFDIAATLAAMDGSIATPLSAPVGEIIDAAKKRHGDAVLKLCAKHGVERDRVHVHQGATPQLLTALAEQLPADLVVLGAVSRSGLKRVFLGSTAEQTLDRLPCDVLVVKPREFGKLPPEVS